MISFIINVKNGANSIAHTLQSIQSFDDIILVDNYSTDNTLEIAQKFNNVRVYSHEFCGMGPLRNIASSYAKYDWVFIIDSDEVLNIKLIDTLKNISLARGNVYTFKRKNYYANYLIDSSSWENDWVVRLYNRLDTKYTDVSVHEAVITDNLIITRNYNGSIYHFPYTEISGLISKTQTYSTWYAKQNYLKKRPTLFSIPFRVILTFIKSYIIKRGFLDGANGFIISSYNAVGVLSKYLKLYELYAKSNFGILVNLNNQDDAIKLVQLIEQQKLLPNLLYIALPENTPTDVAKIKTIVKLKCNLIDFEFCSAKPNDLIDIANKLFDKTSSNNLFIDYIYCVINIDSLQNKSLLKKLNKSIVTGRFKSKNIFINPKSKFAIE